MKRALMIFGGVMIGASGACAQTSTITEIYLVEPDRVEIGWTSESDWWYQVESCPDLVAQPFEVALPNLYGTPPTNTGILEAHGQCMFFRIAATTSFVPYPVGVIEGEWGEEAPAELHPSTEHLYLPTGRDIAAWSQTVEEPPTELYLSAEHSYSPGGRDIVAWLWTVEQPAGGTGDFVPSAMVSNPTFVATVNGAYTFGLHVWDDSGLRSWRRTRCAVDVIPFDNICSDAGTTGDDTQICIGTANRDKIVQHGLDGNDNQYAEGKEANDFIYQDGGLGDDSPTSQGGIGDDWIQQDGGEGSDTLYADGGSGHDWIIQEGGDGADSLVARAGSGNDRIEQRGDSGDDTMQVDGGSGDDDLMIYAEAGDDTIVYETSEGTDNVLIDGGDGTDGLRINENDQGHTVVDRAGDVLYHTTSPWGTTIITVMRVENIYVVDSSGHTKWWGSAP
jgi:hypothetical protein